MKSYDNSGHKHKFSKELNSDFKRNLSSFLKLKVLFGGVTVSIGLIFTIMGLVFTLIFGSFINFNDLKFSKEDPIVPAQLQKMEPTNTWVNDRQVISYYYKYNVNGRNYESKSNTSGFVDTANFYVQYLEEDPQISRIQGSSIGRMSPWVLLITLIFSVIGILMLIIGLIKRSLYVKVLTYGKVALGKFKRMIATGSKVNENIVYKFYFDYVAEDGKVYEAIGETHLIHKLQDEELEPLVYNPSNPNEAVMIDSLPDAVRKKFQQEINLIQINKNNLNNTTNFID